MVNYGSDGEEDDGEDDQGEVVFDGGDIAEEVTGQGESKYPNQPSEDVIRDKFGIFHFAYSGHKGGKSSHDRYKTGQKYGFPPMFGKKSIGLVDVVLVDRDFRVSDNFFTEKMAYPIIGGVSQNGSKKEQAQ